MGYSQSISAEENVKTTRLETRVKSEVKKRLVFAAAKLGSSVSKLIQLGAEKFADKVISQHQILKLNKEDSLAMLNNIKHPDKANKNLQDAFKDYQKSVSSNI
jgi:uncharacterized protein (DUF1778 family)